MSPEQGILILILTLALIGALTCLYLTFKLLRFLLRLLFGSASQRRIREIRRLGQEARQEKWVCFQTTTCNT